MKWSMRWAMNVKRFNTKRKSKYSKNEYGRKTRIYESKLNRKR
jgi:hypothetical protein